MNPIRIDKTAVYRERHQFDRTPVTAELALTDFCSFNCHYCRFMRGDHFLSLEQVKRIVGRLTEWRTRGVVLTGGGEPLMDRDFEDIVSFLKEVEMPYGVNTNMVLYKKMAPVWCKVSVHRETNNRCVQNVKTFREENPKSTLGIQLIVENPEEVLTFYEQYGGLDCDYISFRPVENKRSCYSPEKRDAIVAVIDGIGRYDSRVAKHYKWDFLWRRYPRCTANWSVIFIDAQGNVPYCCHKPTEIVGSFDDSDILRKREEFKSIEECEVPCRQSGNNFSFEQYENEKFEHKEFL